MKCARVPFGQPFLQRLGEQHHLLRLVGKVVRGHRPSTNCAPLTTTGLSLCRPDSWIATGWRWNCPRRRCGSACRPRSTTTFRRRRTSAKVRIGCRPAISAVAARFIGACEGSLMARKEVGRPGWPRQRGPGRTLQPRPSRATSRRPRLGSRAVRLNRPTRPRHRRRASRFAATAGGRWSNARISAPAIPPRSTRRSAPGSGIKRHQAEAGGPRWGRHKPARTLRPAGSRPLAAH